MDFKKFLRRESKLRLGDAIVLFGAGVGLGGVLGFTGIVLGAAAVLIVFGLVLYEPAKKEA